MTTLPRFVIAALFLKQSFLQALAGESDEVEELFAANFDHVIMNNKFTMVGIFSPSCSHCKKIAPKYEEAAEFLKTHNIKCAKIDGTTHGKKIVDKYDVKSFPTFLWFEEDTEIFYRATNGKIRDTESIIEWARQMAIPIVREVTEVKEPRFLPTIVLHAESLLKSFESVARINRVNANWFHIKTKGEPSISIHHREENPISLSGSPVRSNQSVHDFFETNRYPLVGELDELNFENYMETDKGLINVYFKGQGKELISSKYTPQMLEIAKKHRSNYLVTYMEVKKDANHIKELFGESKVEFPAVVIRTKANDKKWFKYNGKLVAKDVSKFVSAIAKGHIAPTSKSEPAPEDNDGPVQVIVANTLKEECFSKEKDVLLEIYAPWCGHCKALEPKYNQLAKKVAKLGLSNYLKIAKMDGTLNDSPVDGIEVEGFPTIYLCKAGMDTPQKYKGERNAEALWKFIMKEGANIHEIQEHLDRQNLKMEL